jgi:hypothetical protein
LEINRLKLRSKVEELMNRDDSESMFCASVILPKSERIDGHVLVDPECASLSELVQVSCVFVVEESDSGPHLLDLYLPQYVKIHAF